MDTSSLTRLPRRGRHDRGTGGPWMAAALASQGLVAALALGGGFAKPASPPPPPAQGGLAAAAVVEPGDGEAPGTLADRESWPAGARLQVSFEADVPGWVQVLWFDGPDHVVPLYPDVARGQTGETSAGRVYVLPREGAFLRLTPTVSGGDLVAVLWSAEPDPEVRRVLADPRPEAVRALRSRLEAEAAIRKPARNGVVRHLPTADGRAVAVPWERVQGIGRLVLGWRVTVI